MLDSKLLSSLETFLEIHTGLDHPGMCRVLRNAREGEAFDLPQAVTPEGSIIRDVLAQAIEVARASAVAPPMLASAPVAVSAPTPAPVATASAISDEERAVAIRAIAGSEVPAATVNALIASGSSVCEAAIILASIKASAAAQAKPRIPTIAERMDGLPEFGGEYMPPRSAKEQTAAGWGKAFKEAEAKRGQQIGG
ncbi:hypothetical protein ASE36_18975 [Rhizobium sp. Root274]|uniref:hypothetical protein n=1 Tax=unclassified Rhizobium TaxID=2613769 RepID=UPI0007141BCF|nr:MULTISPECIES: hypothetical protein [unclassified Rhizobium]KQW27035.1 hypothetical protein ASC71_20100 [Rhizobium sp. Root1240]KRD27903.1 hypothetical protein ASE36_18975 [Rhizobium sp. Root274]